jgi:hypothetical protein
VMSALPDIHRSAGVLAPHNHARSVALKRLAPIFDCQISDGSFHGAAAGRGHKDPAVHAFNAIVLSLWAGTLLLEGDKVAQKNKVGNRFPDFHPRARIGIPALLVEAWMDTRCRGPDAAELR